MVALRYTLAIGLLQLFAPFWLTAQPSLPCATMAQSTPFDQLLESGHSLLSGYLPEDCACFGEYYAKKHISQGNLALLDSEWVPIFELKGYSRCRLAEYGFDYKLIPDLFMPADDRPKARAYIERYNALMLFELKRVAGEENYQDIFHPPVKVDPYILRERLQQLARFGQITRSDWINEKVVQIRLDLKPLYRNLDMDWKKLRFEIIDENKSGSKLIVTLEELHKTGFPLTINSESRKSSVWFDFKIRINYDDLTDTGLVFTCERIDEFLYEYDHLSLTKDLRLISHLH